MRIIKITQKNQQNKNYNLKKKQDRDVFSKKIEEKGEKSLSFLKNLQKANHKAEKCRHKRNLQHNFCKNFGLIEKHYWHKQRNQAIFCEGGEEENLFFLLNLMLQQKAMNDMLIAVVAIT